MKRRYSAIEAGSELGISPSRVRRLAVSRRLGDHLGPMWVFSVADIEGMRDRKRGRPRKGESPKR